MESTALASKFGTLVQRLRHEKGLSQDRFAEVCSIDRTHMGKIERGEVNVTVATTLKLVRGLDLSLSSFFSELERELDDTEVGNQGAAPF
jgi:transcriptional regulator with XRE-family HTH domain